MAPRKAKAAAPAAGSEPAKRTRTSTGGGQPGIAAALAAGAERRSASAAAAELVLEQPQPRDLLAPRLTDELNGQGDYYLQTWGDKCYTSARDGTTGAPNRRAAAAAEAAAAVKEDSSLDEAGLRYQEVLRHLQQQAFQAGVALHPRQLEVLVLMMRSDAVHRLGDVSYQAYSLLQSHLQRYPYASLAHHTSGEHAGRPYVVIDEHAAWQPLEALTKRDGLTCRYIFEEAIKDAGHNYRLEHGSAAAALSGQRKKGGHLRTTFELLQLCFDRAVDSVAEDHNGDLLLLRYLLGLLGQDLRARLQVFHAYADLEDEGAQAQRRRLLQRSLVWRVWADLEVVDHKQQTSRLELVRLLMKLIVGVASEQELQEVEEEAPACQRDADADEAANPCICTPRELAALAAAFLNQLLDCFGAVEAAGGFAHEKNLRLRLDLFMRELLWKNASEAVCQSDESSRAFLAALAPEHRLRLLSQVAMEHVSKAYKGEMAALRVPALKHATELVADATLDRDFKPSAVDPLVALQCLNHEPARCLKVFAILSRESAANSLAVLCCGIVMAAQAIAAAGGEVRCTGAGADAGQDADSSSGGGGGGGQGVQQLREQAALFLRFLADKHREWLGGKRERALELSQSSLLEMLHAHAALGALGAAA